MEIGNEEKAAAAGEVEILKPRTDKREYRRIVLKNSIQVLLISDPETDKCAASMDVSVGSFSDPEGLEGLAHFLEHMLFFASEKYPDEDSYSKFITEHGGSTNAFTSIEQTNYHFDVNADCFEEALDRFAQFFIKPLMLADATMREINAVDSENQKNLLSDARRMHQLQKHLSREDHPFHKFSTGNLDTLHARPQAKGVDTRSELIKFYDEHYSANIMHLVVYGKESLDKIQGLVEEKFQNVRNTNKDITRFPGQPCASDHLQILVKTVPIKEGHMLRIEWPVTPSIHHYKEAPSRYLGDLIGHEGEGSLFHALKTLGWATGLYAGEGDGTLEYSFFEVVISLTDAGHEHMQDILGLLFRYIQLLQQSGICQWIFEELATICETAFHYQDKVQPISYVVAIASNMQVYPIKDWLVGSSLPSTFHPAIIQKVLDELSPDTIRIFWESKKFEGQTDKVEPWYNTAYSVEKITSSAIQEWMQSAPNVNLHLPTPNVFIPTDLSLKDAKDKGSCPVLLRKSPFSRLWYKPDTVFSMPKACVMMDFNCPVAVSSPDAAVLTDIFTWLLTDYLNEYAYDAQVAGLYYEISSSVKGFEILLETIVEKIARFEVKPDRFSVIKETAMKGYQNFKFQQPCEQATYYCSLILQDRSWPWTEELDVISHLEAEDVTKFVPLLLSRTFLECYVAGNVESNEAESMIKHLEDMFFQGPKPICRPMYPSQHLTDRVVKLKKGMKYFYHKDGSNPSDENSAIVHYIQVHRDEFTMNVKLQLFVLIAKQATFHQLRGVEQLGYITDLSQRNNSGVRGVQFIIQSTVKGPGHIDSRVESFLKNFESKLYEMSDEEFKSNVTTLIDMKLEKHKNLYEESWVYWHEIQTGTLRFDRRYAEVAALRKITRQELIDFFNDYIKVGAMRKKSLSIRVYGSRHLSEMACDKEQIPSPSFEIEDIFGFRKSRPLYGVVNGGGMWPSETVRAMDTLGTHTVSSS
ncbi:PREDICTED: insulin-degrading enzyme-like 1, peroxisomal isoform X2 [Tarenaya hassleriana]|uniref:insulin-degrading enzyme-like 1, peroxisomal isoform X2 n=1 Tax=Tarenaya hassleriana TaxID=28532 RepID=UPI00053C5715|nr:PREDICTED: insulin-degrading enzyme-like 1, peroxisomal isoform X2 [Tarenaya hassleriana]